MDYLIKFRKYSIFRHGLFITILLQILHLPVVTSRFSYTVHLTNYSDTFHDFNKSLTRVYYKGDGINGKADVHNQLESISDNTRYNEDSEIIDNGLSRPPIVTVNATSLSSRRHQRQETCMTFMWQRHLSHKVTPSMKSSTCRQYKVCSIVTAYI